MLKKMWDVKKEQIGKRSVFWNMMSSGLNSIVSMLLLLVVTRINGVDDAGVFSLAFSTSQMMLTIGNYGMRNYQATDINEKYSMSVYKASRIVTNMVMLLMACAFVLLNGYYIEKALVTILLCALKATDAMDDVYGGQYQRRGRLDIAGQIMSIRIVLYVIVFCLTLVITHSLLWACLLATICSLCALYMMVLSTRELFRWEKPIFSGKKVFQLLKECLPLCISSFLLIYMSNAPKYAIDTYLTDSAQAYYTYLFMPCFITNLFVGFALQPVLVRMSQAWLHREYKKFLKLCIGILGGAVVISGIIVIAGSVLGTQILSIIFGVELYEYRLTLTILLVGGAFFAFTVIEQAILTVIRKQKFLILGFGISSIMAFIISKPLVKSMGLLGAGIAYSISAGILFLVLGIVIAWSIWRETHNKKIGL